jgi:hypothetical protein
VIKAYFLRGEVVTTSTLNDKHVQMASAIVEHFGKPVFTNQLGEDIIGYTSGFITII